MWTSAPVVGVSTPSTERRMAMKLMELKDCRAVCTVFDGKIVYEDMRIRRYKTYIYLSMHRDDRGDCDGILCTAMIVAAVVASGIWIIGKLGNTAFLVRPAFLGIIAPEI